MGAPGPARRVAGGRGRAAARGHVGRAAGALARRRGPGAPALPGPYRCACQATPCQGLRGRAAQLACRAPRACLCDPCACVGACRVRTVAAPAAPSTAPAVPRGGQRDQRPPQSRRRRGRAGGRAARARGRQSAAVAGLAALRPTTYGVVNALRACMDNPAVYCRSGPALHPARCPARRALAGGAAAREARGGGERGRVGGRAGYVRGRARRPRRRLSCEGGRGRCVHSHKEQTADAALWRRRLNPGRAAVQRGVHSAPRG